MATGQGIGVGHDTHSVHDVAFEWLILMFLICFCFAIDRKRKGEHLRWALKTSVRQPNGNEVAAFCLLLILDGFSILLPVTMLSVLEVLIVESCLSYVGKPRNRYARYSLTISTLLSLILCVNESTLLGVPGDLGQPS